MGIRDLTLFDLARRNVALSPDATWLVFEGERLTHRDALTRAERLAAGLAAAGIGRGDRVAVLAQNRPDHLDLLLACARLGAILLPVNWRLGPDEIAHVMGDGDPALVVADPDMLALLAPLATSGPARRWYAFDDGGTAPFRPYGELAEGGEAAPAIEVGAEDGALLIHTAAVGGKPRGALLSHANLLAQAQQLGQAWALGPADVGLGTLPLFHITGIGLALALQLVGGASVVMRRFDPAAAVALVAAERVSVTCEFAPMLGQMLDAAEAGGADLGSLRAIWGLDAPATIARFEAACPVARFWVGFGQSETSGFVSLAPSRDRPGSAGRPLPLARFAIVDEADEPVPAGQVGEIAVRGPLVFAGYWNLPEETAHTFRSGWHHTGDLGRLDPDGYLVYAGRSPAKELIKSGGENVYPAEVEGAIRAHPAIVEVAAIGVPDPQWHEAVKAVCVLREGQAVEAAELIAFVGDRIARFKRPKHVVFVAALPRTEAGAIDRARIKAEHGEA